MGAQLGMVRAVWEAFRGKKINHFPRKSAGGVESTIETGDAIAAVKEGLSKINFKDSDEAKLVLDQVKTSFTEVKAATEYQDQKTARLLTILAFLTAAAAAIFSKLFDAYPLPHEWKFSVPVVITIVSYALFGTYVLLVSLGALISFHATQTRFLTPEESGMVQSDLKSLVFFKSIAATEPMVWGRRFTLAPKELLTQYVRHFATETYLVAAKASDKVRFLEPAQRILELAIRILVLWVISLAVIVLMVPRSRTFGQESNVAATQNRPVTCDREPSMSYTPNPTIPSTDPKLSPSTERSNQTKESRSAPSNTNALKADDSQRTSGDVQTTTSAKRRPLASGAKAASGAEQPRSLKPHSRGAC